MKNDIPAKPRSGHEQSYSENVAYEQIDMAKEIRQCSKRVLAMFMQVLRVHDLFFSVIFAVMINPREHIDKPRAH